MAQPEIQIRIAVIRPGGEEIITRVRMPEDRFDAVPLDTLLEAVKTAAKGAIERARL